MIGRRPDRDVLRVAEEVRHQAAFLDVRIDRWSFHGFPDHDVVVVRPAPDAPIELGLLKHDGYWESTVVIDGMPDPVGGRERLGDLRAGAPAKSVVSALFALVIAAYGRLLSTFPEDRELRAQIESRLSALGAALPSKPQVEQTTAEVSVAEAASHPAASAPDSSPGTDDANVWFREILGVVPTPAKSHTMLLTVTDDDSVGFQSLDSDWPAWAPFQFVDEIRAVCILWWAARLIQASPVGPDRTDPADQINDLQRLLPGGYDREGGWASRYWSLDLSPLPSTRVAVAVTERQDSRGWDTGELEFSQVVIDGPGLDPAQMFRAATIAWMSDPEVEYLGPVLDAALSGLLAMARPIRSGGDPIALDAVAMGLFTAAAHSYSAGRLA